MNLLKSGVPVIAASLLMLASCHDENPWTGVAGEGRVAPKVKADPTVRDVYPTRANDGLIVPEAENLKVTLSKTDGSYSASWESINLFPEDKTFKIGTYSLEASFGEMENEGFERPYFYGYTEFAVREEEISEPVVTAKLANTMVSIDYTDAFKNYFASYSTQLHSKGGEFITFIPGEDRPAYLIPGEATVTLQITKQNGVSATLEPATINTLAQHHYHLTLDVNEGETGETQLVVNFDESLVQDNVVIDLSDDLLLSPAPSVSTKGFEADKAFFLIEGTQPEHEARFVISAPGGITSATLTTRSAALRAAGFPAEIDLVAATPAQQALLKTFGVDVKGLWHNPDKMASIDLTDVLPKIKGEDTHEFSLVVKDKLTKVNLPCTMVVTTQPVVLEITEAPDVNIDAQEGEVTVNYSGNNIAKNVSIEALDRWGNPVKCEILNATALTRSADSYKVRFRLPDNSSDIKMKIKYLGDVKDTATIHRKGVALSAQEVDIWATHATFSVLRNASVALSDIKFYISTSGETYSEAQSVSRNEADGTITISGLTPGTRYNVKGSETGEYEASYSAYTFTTEASAQPQNAGFDSWSQSSGWHNTVVGIGKETIYEYYPGASNNDYWATSNSKTAGNWGYSSCFYNAYSGTYPVAGASGQAAEIASIGWSNTSNNTYTRLGGNCNEVSRGILFMGTYSYNHDTDTETITLGRPFTSRPSSVEFDYKYAPVSGESWDVVIVVENRTGGKTTELARGTYTSGDSKSAFTKASVKLTYSNTKLKATHAYVYFRSSTAASPAKENKNGSASAFQGYSDSRYVGSTLTIDNIVFKY